MTNSSTLAIPETFPAVLKSFTREILRDSEKQDARSIHAFGFKYFQSLIAERDGLEIVETPTKTETTSPMYVQLKSDRELQTLVLEAFQELDGGLVHASVVMPVFMTLASTLGLSEADVTQVMVESFDESPEEGHVDMHEFVPSVIEVLCTLRSTYPQEEQHPAIPGLWHGMTRDQLESVWLAIAHKAESESEDGLLTRKTFLKCCRDADLGLTSKEQHAIFAHVSTSESESGLVAKTEVTKALRTLGHVYARKLIDVPISASECQEYLTSVVFQQVSSGVTLLELTQGLQEAELGLTRSQVTSLSGEISDLGFLESSSSSEEEEETFELVEILTSLCPKLVDLVALPWAPASTTDAVVAFRSSAGYHQVLGEHQNQYKVELALQSACQARDESGRGVLSLRTVMDVFEETLDVSVDQLRVLKTLAGDYLDDDDGSVAYFELTKHVFSQLQHFAEQHMILGSTSS